MVISKNVKSDFTIKHKKETWTTSLKEGIINTYGNIDGETNWNNVKESEAIRITNDKLEIWDKGCFWNEVNEVLQKSILRLCS